MSTLVVKFFSLLIFQASRLHTVTYGVLRRLEYSTEKPCVHVVLLTVFFYAASNGQTFFVALW